MGPPRQCYHPDYSQTHDACADYTTVCVEQAHGVMTRLMAIVFIPAMLQPLTGGVSQVRVAGRTIRTIINNLEERFPGVKERLLQEGDLRPDVAIAVDGEMGLDGLAEQVGEDSEVHFIPPISGG